MARWDAGTGALASPMSLPPEVAPEVVRRPRSDLNDFVAQYRVAEVLEAVAQHMEQQLAELCQENAQLREMCGAAGSPAPPRAPPTPLHLSSDIGVALNASTGHSKDAPEIASGQMIPSTTPHSTNAGYSCDTPSAPSLQNPKKYEIMETAKFSLGKGSPGTVLETAATFQVLAPGTSDEDFEVAAHGQQDPVVSDAQEQVPLSLAREREQAFEAAASTHDVPVKPARSLDQKSRGSGRQSVLSQVVNVVSQAAGRSPHKEQAPTPLFADVGAMKDAVRESLLQKQYDVRNFYHTTGWPQAIARNSKFEVLTMSVISFNALWIAIDTDFNGSKTFLDKDIFFQVMDYIFFTYFFMEWCVRLAAFRKKCDGFKDNWFTFDTALVAVMFIDTWLPLTVGRGGDGRDTSLLKVVRVSRITRMARMAKLLRNAPELIILLKGIWVAGRSVSFTLMLLLLLVYVFAVAFRQLTHGTPVGEKYFPNMFYAMKALLLYGALPDNAAFVDDLGEQSLLLGGTILIFVMFASLCLLNMLVGVLCEVVSNVSSVEKEEMKVSYVKTQLCDMLNDLGLDADEDMMITRQEFSKLLLKPDAAKVILDVGVDPINLVDFGDYMFENCGPEGLAFRDFIEWILELRGTNHATVKDMVDLRKLVLQRMNHMEKLFQKTMTHSEHITELQTRKIVEQQTQDMDMLIQKQTTDMNVLIQNLPIPPVSSPTASFQVPKRLLPLPSVPLPKSRPDAAAEAPQPPSRGEPELRGAAESESSQPNDQETLPGIPPNRQTVQSLS